MQIPQRLLTMFKSFDYFDYDEYENDWIGFDVDKKEGEDDTNLEDMVNIQCA